VAYSTDRSCVYLETDGNHSHVQLEQPVTRSRIDLVPTEYKYRAILLHPHTTHLQLNVDLIM
jgi:hypothetical protein